MGISGLFIGILVGIILQRGQFCISGQLGYITRTRSLAAIAPIAVAVAIQMIGFYVLSLYGYITIPSSPMPFVATVVGSVLFGRHGNCRLLPYGATVSCRPGAYFGMDDPSCFFLNDHYYSNRYLQVLDCRYVKDYGNHVNYSQYVEYFASLAHCRLPYFYDLRRYQMGTHV